MRVASFAQSVLPSNNLKHQVRELLRLIIYSFALDLLFLEMLYLRTIVVFAFDICSH